MLRLRSSISVV